MVILVASGRSFFPMHIRTQFRTYLVFPKACFPPAANNQVRALYLPILAVTLIRPRFHLT
jgi:hypothetical protein